MKQKSPRKSLFFLEDGWKGKLQKVKFKYLLKGQRNFLFLHAFVPFRLAWLQTFLICISRWFRVNRYEYCAFCINMLRNKSKYGTNFWFFDSILNGKKYWFLKCKAWRKPTQCGRTRIYCGKRIKNNDYGKWNFNMCSYQANMTKGRKEEYGKR